MTKQKNNLITIKTNEKFLRQKSQEVDFNDCNLKEYVQILEKYCMENEVMAMAAIQLGIPKRIVYLKNTNLDIVSRFQNGTSTKEDNSYNEARVLINPVITEKIGLTTYWEACASCLNNVGLIKRPYKLVVEYYDINGNKQKSIFEGFEATVLSHEIDHLDGILHIDVADEVLLMTPEERKKFRQDNGYTILFKCGLYDMLVTDVE